MISFLLLGTAFAEITIPEQLSYSEEVLEIEQDNIQAALSAQKNGKGKGKIPKKKKSKIVTVPIEIGVGPTGYHFGARNGIDKPFHTGVSLSGHAVISNKLIRENKHMIPKQYRKMAMAQEEIRISKLWIPEAIIISPSTTGTSAFGVSFRPISAALIKAKNSKGFSLDLGARATYAQIKYGRVDVSSPHFIGLGVDAKAEYRIRLKKGQLKGRWLGIGWASHVYVPQDILFGSDSGSSALDPSQWHTSQAFIKYYYRFPYQYRP